MKTTYILFNKYMAAWLRAAREGLDIRQHAVEKELGLSQAYLSTHERGEAEKMDRARWQKLRDFYIAKGSAPIDPKHDPLVMSLDPASILRKLKAFKKSTGASWVAIAATLGVEPRRLVSFQAGKSTSAETSGMIQRGFEKMESHMDKLVKDGSISKEGAHAKTAKVATKKPKASVIHAVPVLPTSVVLAIRELEAIKILKEYDVTNRDFMNGSAGKLLQA